MATLGSVALHVYNKHKQLIPMRVRPLISAGLNTIYSFIHHGRLL